MKHRKFALGMLVVGLVMLAAAPAWATLPRAADWKMDDTVGQMLDSSPNKNDGNPIDVIRTGKTYIFNGSTSHVVVPDSDSLDPLEKDITLRASLRVSGTTLNDDSYDIVRKGLARTPGGDYKMEISNASSDHTRGKLHCYFKGTGGTVHVKAPVNLLDGNWHNLVCAKTNTSVVASVDGQSYAQPGSAGSISNSTNLMVGAKTANPFDDVFEGRIAFARISIAQ